MNLTFLDQIPGSGGGQQDVHQGGGEPQSFGEVIKRLNENHDSPVELFLFNWFDSDDNGSIDSVAEVAAAEEYIGGFDVDHNQLIDNSEYHTMLDNTQQALVAMATVGVMAADPLAVSLFWNAVLVAAKEK